MMKIVDKKNTSIDTNTQIDFAQGAGVMQALSALSGPQILKQILETDNPRELVQHVSEEDFFWLVKKVGNDDSLPLLRLASDDQKQHLLDLELWKKDRPNLAKLGQWIGRLNLADPRGLIQWFRTQGEALAYYFFFKNIRVEIKNEDEIQDLEGKFTVDGTYYVNILDKANKETVEGILRTLASEDLERYQNFLMTVEGVIPAELEEDMFRMRNMRLAEHGFLPFEEALAVYARLTPEVLTLDGPNESVKAFHVEEVRNLVATAPLYHAQGDILLTSAFSSIDDKQILDRLRIEFAGLCNQIIAADGVWADELDVLIRTCRKAAGHLNLALEKVCGTNIPMAAKLLKHNSLLPLFRVGFGLVLELKWEAERWMKKSWFLTQGLEMAFWGDDWAERLRGIVENRPRYYVGFEGEDGYKFFEHISELEDCKKWFYRLKALDFLLECLPESHMMVLQSMGSGSITFHHILFTMWARRLLALDPSYSLLSKDQVKAFFLHLRAEEKKPPYQMPGFGERFVNDFCADIQYIEPGPAADLKDALHLIWQEFVDEYASVTIDTLDERFSHYFETT